MQNMLPQATFKPFDRHSLRFTGVLLISWLTVGLFVVGCSTVETRESSSGKPRPYKALGKWYQPIEDADGFRQRGKASWYGKDFHGRKTANGETYNMYAISAAHKTLPFNTWVRVYNLENGRRLDVRINDRGPFVRGRIIDLSYGAAKKLGVVGPGTADVEVIALGTRTNKRSKTNHGRLDTDVDYRHGNFTFQVGAFMDRENAEQLKAQLARKYKHVHIAAFDDGQSTYYRVRVGRFTNVDQARQKEKILIEDGYEPIIVAE